MITNNEARKTILNTLRAEEKRFRERYSRLSEATRQATLDGINKVRKALGMSKFMLREEPWPANFSARGKMGPNIEYHAPQFRQMKLEDYPGFLKAKAALEKRSKVLSPATPASRPTEWVNPKQGESVIWLDGDPVNLG